MPSRTIVPAFLLTARCANAISASVPPSPLLTTRILFQAEDGIRDYKVTGVQTCALPILVRDPLRLAFQMTSEVRRIEMGTDADLRQSRRMVTGSAARERTGAQTDIDINEGRLKIGRASWRERV